jgi:hypothetical protein
MTGLPPTKLVGLVNYAGDITANALARLLTLQISHLYRLRFARPLYLLQAKKEDLKISHFLTNVIAPQISSSDICVYKSNRHENSHCI